jgi:pimeloyl-ACP methyl ester carboxylesterase
MTKPDIKGKYITSADNQTIYYEASYAEKDAPIIVLVHGIGGDVDGWQFVRDRLFTAGFSSLVLDVRGHGYSAHPRHAKHYKMRLLLKDIAHVVDAEGLDRVILIGHSGGAILALNFALEYPERLQGLVLLAGSYRAPAYIRSPFTKKIADSIITLGALISPPHPGPWHSTYIEGKFARDYEPWGLVRTIYRNSLRSYLFVGRELFNIELEDRLKEITVSTLIVAGENDSIYNVDIPKKMHEKIPDAYLKIIPGANHVLIHNNAEETARYIIEFVRNLHLDN